MKLMPYFATVGGAPSRRRLLMALAAGGLAFCLAGAVTACLLT